MAVLICLIILLSLDRWKVRILIQKVSHIGYIDMVSYASTIKYQKLVGTSKSLVKMLTNR